MMKGKLSVLLLMLAAMAYTAPAAADTARAQMSPIEKTVFGTGAVQPQSQPGVYAKLDSDVVSTLVSVGDAVSKGDVLMKLENEEIEAERHQAHYDMATAEYEILYTKTHEQVKYKQLRDDEGDLRFDVNTDEPIMIPYSNEITIRAPSDGRIMAIYIEKGDDALAVFRDKGAVIMLSTDGRMKVRLKSKKPMDLELSEKVIVAGKDKNGKDFSIQGSVTSLTRRGLEAEVHIDSDRYPMDCAVTVTKKTGELLGESILEISKPMAVSAYGGTIKGVSNEFAVGSMVKRYDVLARIEWSEIPLYIDNAKALREFAKAKVTYDKANEKLESLAVTAPCDGIVASVDVSEGDSITDGTLLLSVLDTNAGMKLSLFIDELDIVHVQPGQQVKVVADALPEKTMTGVVDKIAPLGNTENSVTTYEVFVSLTGDVDERVKGGMNVSGEIVISDAQNVLTIPTDALRKGENGWCVMLTDGSMADVETGIMTDSRVQILSGLSEGETVVY